MPTPIRLVAGLGNPGRGYAATRHNAGFWFADALAQKLGVPFSHEGRFAADVAKAGEVRICKPMTYMNGSGRPVAALARFFRMPPESIIVVHDELDLRPGDVRLKLGGGHAGHNGLRDTITHLGPDFWRLRLGIGHPGDKAEVIDYVLRRAPKDEEESLLEAVGDALSTLPTFLEQGAERAMNGLHGKG